MSNSNKFITDLYELEYKNLLSYARVVLGDSDIAQDVVQDTFHEAVRKADLLSKHPKPRAWLMEVLKHKIQHAKRERSNNAKMLVALEVNYRDDGVRLIDSKLELNQIVSRMQHCLDVEDFYIFRRYFFDNASHLQIAEELNITVWASRKRLERIRKEVKRQFPDREMKKIEKSKIICHFLIFLGMI